MSTNDERSEVLIALALAMQEHPEKSVGWIVQSAVTIIEGYWPGSTRSTPDARLVRGLRALIPDEDEAF